MRITGRQWVMPVLLLLLLAGTVAVQHSEWSHTTQLVCIYAAFFIVIVAGICHGKRQQKKEIAARHIRDEQKINEMQVLLESLKRSSICLSPLAANADSEPLPVALSKYGGQPDLPADYEWPRDNTGRPLSLLLQIDCAALAAFDQAHLFPTAGHLYFFYELSAMEWDNRNRVAQVFYCDTPSRALHPVPFPDDLPEACRIAEHALHFSTRESIPGWDDLFQMGLYHYVTDLNAYEEATRRMKLPPVGNAIGTLSGYADTIQSSLLTDTPEDDILLLNSSARSRTTASALRSCSAIAATSTSTSPAGNLPNGISARSALSCNATDKSFFYLPSPHKSYRLFCCHSASKA